MGQATEVYSREFDDDFFKLPDGTQQRIANKIARMGAHLKTFPHQRLANSDQYKLRVGDYRIIYRFDAELGEVYLLALGHRREVYKKRP